MRKGETTSCESYFQGFPYNINMTPHRQISEQKDTGKLAKRIHTYGENNIQKEYIL